MKQVMGLVGVLVLVAGCALADTATVSLTLTNGQATTYSDAIPASGWLDKIEIVNTDGAACTSTVVIATYSGTTAVETFGTASVTTPKVIRPRYLPTANTGVALSGATTSSTGSSDGTNITNVVATTVLNIPYERPLIGGNLKMAASCVANDTTNTVTAVLYYEPLKK